MPFPQSYREITPTALTRRAVETVWTYGARTDDTHLILPDGRMDIILRYTLTNTGQCTNITPIIAGPTDMPATIPIPNKTGFVGLRLLPGRAGGFGHSAQTFQHQSFHGDAATALIPALQNLTYARTPKALGDRLQTWVSNTITAPDIATTHTLTTALDLLHVTGGRAEISNLALVCDRSERHLHRLFLHWVGLAPKTLSNIVRFHRALRLLDAGLLIAATAHEAGYADQAHMTRQFRHLGGITPNRRPNMVLAGFGANIGS